MFSRVFIISVFLSALSGCVYNEEPTPKIIYDHSDKVISSVPLKPVREPITLDRNIPRNWLPSTRTERKWTAIVIHHSGTRDGNMAIFDKWHREGNHWEGVGYDFVIGNGTDSPDGYVEATYRWRNQQTGAHCGGTPGNWANKYAIGICLVGNFNETIPSRRQKQSLVKLVSFLQSRYSISKRRIYSHRTTPGARITDCPGRRFSMTKLRATLER